MKDKSSEFVFFSEEEIRALDERSFEKNVRGKPATCITCLIRNKDVQLKPEERTRQLWLACLIDQYGYPASKRPRAVQDDAIIFIARLTSKAHDIRIFGRAVGMKHQPGRDDATFADIERRPWKENGHDISASITPSSSPGRYSSGSPPQERLYARCSDGITY